ncbi:hypothetical protein K1T71_009788 [Dendrolimus kikuchii]|uniref:Uncharacterized protein n=1 Tax=Dendrolimus kikuchii TaxID=765133 RepID=A0ACC1CTC5_9NEOP|nr:hypothetical protein K1T71_009788 [Dendrolimus kikuchii]
MYRFRVLVMNFNLKEILLYCLYFQHNKHLQIFLKHIKDGNTAKDKTFTIYNDKLRETAISLFRLLKSLNKGDRIQVQKWAQENINSGIYNYANHIHILFGNEYNTEYFKENPEFIRHPNFFITTDVFTKFVTLKYYILLNFCVTDPAIELHTLKNYAVINSNYSNWDANSGDTTGIEYFTEDVSLNSYYYGISLAYPFWMTDEELREVNPRHNEQFYFLHKQLVSRFILELHSKELCDSIYEYPYNPNLINDNGIEFPIRPGFNINATEKNLNITPVDTAIRECISRGFLLLENGTRVNLTENNNIDLLVSMIRNKLDGFEMANKLRTYIGSGSLPRPYDIPSVLHYPQTTLRDPGAFMMFFMGLDYIFDYLETLEPYDLKHLNTEEYKITNFSHTRIETFFENYIFDINTGLAENPVFLRLIPDLKGAVKQRRLNVNAFTFNLKVHSRVDKNVTVRYFLGPDSSNIVECCGNYYRFFQLEQRREHLVPGENLLKWDSRYCFSCSNDEYFNLKKTNNKKNEYSMFDFPRRLLMPRGHKKGIVYALFVIVTEDDTYDVPKNNYNEQVFKVQNSRPLGFPFHKPLKNCIEQGNNFGFFDIIIYHTSEEKKKVTSFWDKLTSLFG